MKKHKKDIGVLISEKLSQAQKSPSEELWNRINDTLDTNKKKRRGIYFWFTTIGLTLVLSILYLIIGAPFLNSDPILNEKNTIEIENSKNSVNNLKAISSEEHIEDYKDLIDPINKDTNKPNKLNLKKESNSKYDSKNKHIKDDTINYKDLNNKTKNYSNKEKQKKANNNSLVTKNENSDKTVNIETFTNKSKNLKNPVTTSFVENSEVKDSPDFEIEKRLKLREKRKESINKIRAERKDSITKLRKQKEETFEEEKVEKKDSIPEDSNDKIKINITLIAAPQFSSVTNSGSIINSQLDDLDVKGENNFNYGASLNFLGIKRMYSIGVLKTRISYQTLNVPILDYSTIDKDASVFYSISDNFKNNDGTINLIQNIEYIEVPLIFTYFISEKRFGLQVYGGISSYFLSDNTLVVENNSGEKLTIGNANNLSDISLSLNAGAGIYYNISKIFTAEINPTFKFLYQPTTTQSTKGSVLLFGIYTGLRINLTPNRN